MKKIRIGRYTIPALLLVAIIVGSVAATAYVVLQWTTTATVKANPDICFTKWADKSKANTFDYAVDIFPYIITIDENITYAVSNYAASAKGCSMRLANITTPANIAWVNCTVIGYYSINTTTTTDFVAFSPDLPAYRNATIYLSIKCASGATGSSVLTFELKESV